MRVAILAFPRVQLLDVVGPADVFSEAARQLGNPRAYQVQVLATGAGPLRGSRGLRRGADAAAVQYGGRIDTLLVAGSPDIDAVARDDELREWLRRQARTVRRFGSVCSGAVVLPGGGLLGGRRVAADWDSPARLAAEYPDAQVSADSIYVKDGNLYTSAGVTAGMDLALSMVEEDHGRDLALQVARELVMFLKRPGGQSQFSAHLAAQAVEKSEVRKLQEYVLANLRADLSVPALAKRARMSERNFARVFKDETRMTPAEFVEKARLDASMAILQKENIPLKKVAAMVGYANEDGFRRAFTRRIGINPAEYRKRF